MKNGIVVDLDGTLLNTNTFKKFITFIGKKSLSKCNIITPLYFCLLVLLRKIRLISSHERFKYYILKHSTKHIDEKLMVEFSNELVCYENRKLLDLIDQYREKDYALILSTAAPNVYANIIGKYYKFDAVCSSEMPNNDDIWKENVNEQKKRNTLALLGEHNMKLSVFITDHYDDIPLLLYPKDKNIIVNPSNKTLCSLDKHNIKYELLN